MKQLGIVIALFLSVIAIGFFGLEWRRFFEPKHAAISRQVFEQTPSFVHGKIQYLTRLRAQYEAAETDASRTSLRILIQTEASTVSPELFPDSLTTFLSSL